METLLAFCARASAQADSYGQLAQLAHRVSNWTELARQAERHGLGPLLYTHLQAAAISPPAPVRRELQALYLRHRHANRVKTQVLGEILKTYQAAGVTALVLKGAALAHLVYPEPGLRPMRDIDLLVRKSQARQSQALLAELGFNAPLVDSQLPAGHRHLPVAQRQGEGLVVSVEIHHNLFAHGTPAAELDALLPAALPVTLGEVTAYTLGYEAMLWHLYQHMKTIFGDTRLIGVADLVSFAEHFAAAIDWPRLRRQHPQLLNALALCHFLTPLSESLLNQACLKVNHAPRNLSLQFQGWPRYALADQQAKGWGEVWRDTFFPPAGWLRLYYGFDDTGPAWGWHRWGRHPLHILGWVADYILTRGKHASNPQTPA